MQAVNNTPFKVMPNPGFDKDGREVVSVIVKGTFGLIDRKKAEAEDPDKQEEIVMADECWGAPGASPLKRESDLALFKPGTDLILVGSACAEDGLPARHFEVSFSVGAHKKSRSFNFLGKKERLPLHAIDWDLKEDKWIGAKKPKDGFGFFPRHASPRVGYAGTYDANWKTTRCPFLPEDFDYRFFHAAYPDLVCLPAIRGDETVEVAGTFPGPAVTTALPAVGIEVEAFIKTERTKAWANLDTVIVDADARRLVLVWRSVFKIAGSPADVAGFVINRRPLPH